MCNLNASYLQMYKCRIPGTWNLLCGPKLSFQSGWFYFQFWKFWLPAGHSVAWLLFWGLNMSRNVMSISGQDCSKLQRPWQEWGEEQPAHRTYRRWSLPAIHWASQDGKLKATYKSENKCCPSNCALLAWHSHMGSLSQFWNIFP